MTTPDAPLGSLAEAGKEIIPKVYEDILQPAAKEVGHSLGGVVRTALRPVNAIVWTADQASTWLESKVTQLLNTRGVPADNVTSPSPQVLFEVIRGIQATGEDVEGELREMYAALLATSMDRDASLTAHPAFGQLLHQMVSDEAKLIRLLARRSPALVNIRLDAAHIHRSPNDQQPYVGQRLSRELESLSYEASCTHVSITPAYLDNLKRLGLVTTQEERINEFSKEFPPSAPPLEPTDIRVWLFAYDYSRVRELLEEFSSFRKVGDVTSTSVTVQLGTMSLTSFGSQFVKACVGP